MFTTRNLYYLKISADVILPLYVYLDQQHTQWMSDYILQQVLRDLKPLIGPKIALEGDELYQLGSKNPKATVDVVRGEGYQFAFFFRKLEQHAILIKSRNFQMAPHSKTIPTTSNRLSDLSNPTEPESQPTVRNRREKRTRVPDSDEDEDSQMIIDQPQAPKPRTARRKKQRTLQDSDSEPMIDDKDADPDFAPDKDSNFNDSGPTSMTAGIVIKDEEPDPILPRSPSGFSRAIDVDEDEKPKMAMHLSYSGYHIPGRHLCVIVEPYPPLRPDQLPIIEPEKAPELRFKVPTSIPRLQTVDKVPLNSREGPTRLRSETPLFLPEDEDEYTDERMPMSDAKGKGRQLPPVPMFKGRVNDEDSDDDGNGDTGLIAFSQSLANVRYQIGGSDSEEDYLRGDADENARVME
ncbi:hypothetical protein FRC20_007525 [Serendipita sp. 405]|nr:hypothetical protein FRC18_010348 [Serendipita sp. 400]KAG8866797.1 hypothetical protein FRC20_007525 [Serendipita sp. 405]